MKFKIGDRVVRIAGHPELHTHVGEFATVARHPYNNGGEDIVPILFDRHKVFEAKIFLSYAVNLELVEEDFGYDIDE